jgi:hypothetical protein
MKHQNSVPGVYKKVTPCFSGSRTGNAGSNVSHLGTSADLHTPAIAMQIEFLRVNDSPCCGASNYKTKTGGVLSLEYLMKAIRFLAILCTSLLLPDISRFCMVRA